MDNKDSYGGFVRYADILSFVHFFLLGSNC